MNVVASVAEMEIWTKCAQNTATQAIEYEEDKQPMNI